MSMGIQESLTTEVERMPNHFIGVVDILKRLDNTPMQTQTAYQKELKTFSENLDKNSNEKSKCATQKETKEGSKFYDNKVPDITKNKKSSEIDINPRDEKILANIFAKRNIKYSMENIDDKKTRVIMLSENKEILQEAIKEYIKEIDRVRTVNNIKDKDKQPYKELKNEAKEKLSIEKELDKDKSKIRENKKDINMSL